MNESCPKSDLERAKELAGAGCPDAEIADILRLRPRAFQRRFGKITRQARAQAAAEAEMENSAAPLPPGKSGGGRWHLPEPGAGGLSEQSG